VVQGAQRWPQRAWPARPALTSRAQIYEDGLDVPTQAWAVDRMIANGGLVNFTIPACIEPGQYLLRHEVLGALL
jgi:hypothetical protein